MNALWGCGNLLLLCNEYWILISSNCNRNSSSRYDKSWPARNFLICCTVIHVIVNINYLFIKTLTGTSIHCASLKSLHKIVLSSIEKMTWIWSIFVYWKNFMLKSTYCILDTKDKKKTNKRPFVFYWRNIQKYLSESASKLPYFHTFSSKYACSPLL